jgi:RNA polymerase sigma-70 factor (ECF subfamily)
VDAEENELIQRAAQAEPAACRRLVAIHARTLHRTCRAILGDAQLAEDAVQDAFLQAFRHLDQFDGRAPFEAWLRRIARHAALAIVRRDPGLRNHTVAADDDEVLDLAGDAADTDPLRRAASDEVRAQLSAALGRLSPAERTAFLLRHVEQQSLADIAGALGSNTNAIKQALFRGVRKLREALSTHREEVS